MKKISILSFFIAFLTIATISCKKDSDETLRLRDYTEVATENDEAIRKYLAEHYYDATTEKIGKITSSSGQTPLTNLVRSKRIRILDTNRNEVYHTLYYFITREGNGQRASVADSSYVVYQGRTLDDKVFETLDSFSMANWFDLLGTSSSSGTIVGFRESVALLKDSSDNITKNADGTYSAPANYGKGFFFIPSGIAYFSSPINGITYTPLVYEIGLVKTKNADHDRDNIPSIREIQYNEENGVITFPDCNENGRVDYLDTTRCN